MRVEPQPIHLHSLSPQKAEKLLAAQADAPVFFFVNPPQYCGPHLPANTSDIISKGLAEILHQRFAEENPDLPYFWGGDLAYGIEPTPGPGAVDTSARKLDALLAEYCRRLHEMGARRIIFMTFHGNVKHNIAIQQQVDALGEKGIAAINPMNLAMREIIHYDIERARPSVRHIPDRIVQERILRNMPKDFHAGFFQTSLMLYLKPEAVDESYKTLPACIASEVPAWQRALLGVARPFQSKNLSKELDSAVNALAWLAMRPFPGYTSEPAYAAAEAGEYIAGNIIDTYYYACEQVFKHRQAPPRPVLEFVEML